MSVLLVTLGLALVLENVGARALLGRLQDRADRRVDRHLQGAGRHRQRAAPGGARAPCCSRASRSICSSRAPTSGERSARPARTARWRGSWGSTTTRIYGVAYGLSAALMAIAAAVLVPFFYVHPGVGTSFLLKVFVIVVLGGIGSMPGAAVGGLLVGGSRASSASTCRPPSPRSCCSRSSSRSSSCGRRVFSASSAGDAARRARSPGRPRAARCSWWRLAAPADHARAPRRTTTTGSRWSSG